MLATAAAAPAARSFAHRLSNRTSRGPVARAQRRTASASLDSHRGEQAHLAAEGAQSRRALFASVVAAAALPIAPARADDAEASAESTPLAVKIAKLGGILVVADVISGLVLGRSVLNIAKKDGDQGGDWKEKVADALLGVKGSTPDGSDSPAAPAGPANSMRVEGLLARVRGLRFTSGLRFKEDVIDVIDSAYDYVPTEYRTGADTAWEMVNPAGKNEGSCKTFYFAQMHGLDPKETVALFAEYALEVEATPQGSSHPNIRAFQRTGWKGVKFAGTVLTPKGGK